MIGRPGPLPRRRDVVVDRDDQAIRFGGGGLQVADVADVQQVEAAVGEGEGPAGCAVGAHEIDEIRRVSIVPSSACAGSDRPT